MPLIQNLLFAYVLIVGLMAETLMTSLQKKKISKFMETIIWNLQESLDYFLLGHKSEVNMPALTTALHNRYKCVGTG